MVNSNVGIFFDAPSWHHKDYYAFLLFQRYWGSFKYDENGTHLNNVGKSYNALHTQLAALPDVSKSEAVYSAYSDCGIIGNYFYGNEMFTRQMNWLGLCTPPMMAQYTNLVEVYRGRNKLFNELLQMQSVSEVMQQIGP